MFVYSSRRATRPLLRRRVSKQHSASILRAPILICTAEVFDYLLQRRRTFLCAVGVINWDCCMPAPPMSKCSWGRFVPALPEYCWSKCSWSRFMPALPEYCWGRFVPAPPMNSVVSIWSLGGEVQKVAVGSERVCSSVPSRTPSRSIAERVRGCRCPPLAYNESINRRRE